MTEKTDEKTSTGISAGINDGISAVMIGGTSAGISAGTSAQRSHGANSSLTGNMRVLLAAFIMALLCSTSTLLHAAPESVAQDQPAVTVNINTADAEELAIRLDGVGVSRAEAIVAYRNQHGEFSSLEDLLAVRGIGEGLVDANRARIKFTGGE